MKDPPVVEKMSQVCHCLPHLECHLISGTVYDITNFLQPNSSADGADEINDQSNCTSGTNGTNGVGTGESNHDANSVNTEIANHQSHHGSGPNTNSQSNNETHGNGAEGRSG